MVVALGADAQPLLGLLAEDRRLAAGAALPEPFRHAPLRMLHQVLPTARIGGSAGMVRAQSRVRSWARRCSLHCRAASISSGFNVEDLERARGRWRAFHRSPSSPWVMKRRARLDSGSGRTRPITPSLCRLNSLRQRRADPLVGLAEHFALGRADVLRLLLPLAIDLRLLVAHVLDQHPLPQPLVQVLQPLDLLQLDPQRLGDHLGRLQRRLRDGRIDDLDPFVAQLLGRLAPRPAPARSTECPGSLESAPARRSRSNRDESTRSEHRLNSHFLSLDLGQARSSRAMNAAVICLGKTRRSR